MIAAVGDCLEEVTDVRSGIQRIVVVGNDPVWIPARAISLRQPWAYLMLALPEAVRKDIENRTTGFRSINFRGPVWVHASGRPLRKQYEAAVIACRQRGVPEQWIPTWNQTLLGCRHGLESGSIVGQFCIDDYLAPTSTPKARWCGPWPTPVWAPVSTA